MERLPVSFYCGMRGVVPSGWVFADTISVKIEERSTQNDDEEFTLCPGDR